MGDRLEEIKRRWKQATPGPWWVEGPLYSSDPGPNEWGDDSDKELEPGAIYARKLSHKSAKLKESEIVINPYSRYRWADAVAISNAPTDIAWLISEISAAREAEERYKQAAEGAINDREVMRNLILEMRDEYNHLVEHQKQPQSYTITGDKASIKDLALMLSQEGGT